LKRILVILAMLVVITAMLPASALAARHDTFTCRKNGNQVVKRDVSHKRAIRLEDRGFICVRD
jgi:hypothetical protein